MAPWNHRSNSLTLQVDCHPGSLLAALKILEIWVGNRLTVDFARLLALRLRGKAQWVCQAAQLKESSSQSIFYLKSPDAKLRSSGGNPRH